MILFLQILGVTVATIVGIVYLAIGLVRIRIPHQNALPPAFYAALLLAFAVWQALTYTGLA